MSEGLKVGDRVYAARLWSDEKDPDVETAIVKTIGKVEIHLAGDGTQRYPGLAFGCKVRWPANTPFARTPREAIGALIRKLEEEVKEAERVLARRKANLKKAQDKLEGME